MYTASSGARAEAAQRLEHRVGIGLVALGVVGADEHVGELAEKRQAREGELDGGDALGGHDPELVAAAAELEQQLGDPVECLERRVERLVVGAVHVDELVDPVGVEVVHLRDQAGPADRGAHELLVRLAAEHGHRGVAHRGDDDRPRVDQGAVEIEEDDAVAHAARSYLGRARCPASAGHPGCSVRVLHPLEIQPPRRRRRTALEARPALEQGGEPLRAAPAASSRRACAPCDAGTSRP